MDSIAFYTSNETCFIVRRSKLFLITHFQIKHTKHALREFLYTPALHTRRKTFRLYRGPICILSSRRCSFPHLLDRRGNLLAEDLYSGELRGYKGLEL